MVRFNGFEYVEDDIVIRCPNDCNKDCETCVIGCLISSKYGDNVQSDLLKESNNEFKGSTGSV